MTEGIIGLLNITKRKLKTQFAGLGDRQTDRRTAVQLNVRYRARSVNGCTWDGIIALR